MVLLIDNYDSFSYNLYQLIGTIDSDIKVVRNDEVSLEEIKEMQPSHIILSPGPGRPKDAGICEGVVEEFASKIPILGVCLGHQAICETYGANITYADKLMHGKTSDICINTKSKIFNGINREITVARYHSLACNKNTLPDCLEIIAATDNGEIMAVKHSEYEIYGLQFHPESILTSCGYDILKNFLKIQ